MRTYQSGEDLKNASENNIILQMGAKSWSSLLKTSLYRRVTCLLHLFISVKTSRSTRCPDSVKGEGKRKSSSGPSVGDPLSFSQSNNVERADIGTQVIFLK